MNTRVIKSVVCLMIVAVLFRCSSTKTGSAADQNQNNVIVSKSENSIHMGKEDKIIFEGSNNLFEIVSKNSAFFDQHHQVIIVKGSNSLIRLISVNILTLGGGRDTLVIVGDKEKYVVDTRNEIVLPAGTRLDTVFMAEPEQKGYMAVVDDVVRDERIKLAYFDTLVSAPFAFKYFQKLAAQGDPEGYFELGELYLYGVGVEESAIKALDLFEYAAVKNHIGSLMKLGDLYSGKFGFQQDRARSLYYYKRCRDLGSAYCGQMVEAFGR